LTLLFFKEKRLIEKYINTIQNENCFEFIDKLPDNSIDAIITSPPYWNLRSYSTKPIIFDGSKDCEHEWGMEKRTDKRGITGSKLNGRNPYIGGEARINTVHGFCSKCNAWMGEFGGEPDFRLYVKHLVFLFDKIKRVLKSTGTCWVNLGDSYGGSGNRSGHTPETTNLNTITQEYGATDGNAKFTKGYEKSLLGIPDRFKIAMIDSSWKLRNQFGI